MRTFVAWLLALLMVFDPVFASQAAARTLPHHFLSWDQFRELPDDHRTVYLSYLLYVSAVMQDVQYEHEVIGLAPDLNARFDYDLDLENLWRHLSLAPEAHAVAPAVYGAGVVAARVGAWAFKSPAARAAMDKLSGTWQVFREASGRLIGRFQSSSGKVVQGEVKAVPKPGGGGPATPSGGGRDLVPYRPQGTAVDVVRGGRALEAAAPRGGQVVPHSTPLKPAGPAAPATPAASGGVGQAIKQGAIGAGVVEGVQCAAGGGLCTAKDPKAPNPTTPTDGGPPAAPAEPPYARDVGATCIFGGYDTTYSEAKDGGCKPPPETINAKECKGVKKPNFRCNDFDMAKGDAAVLKQMCIPLSKNLPLEELTERCLKMNQYLLQSRRPSIVTKDQYEKLVEQIQKQIERKNAKGMSIRQYCGVGFDNAANEKRQARECQALASLLKTMEELAPASVPAGPPAAPPAAAPPPGTTK